MTELDPQAKLTGIHALGRNPPGSKRMRDAGLSPIRDTYDIDCTHEILLLLNQEPEQPMIKPDR
ncbi:MAG: hypothetical protein U0892_03175 [Pirellulales bacterium]